MVKKAKKKIEGVVELPEGISASIESSEVVLSGKGGELRKILKNPFVKIEVKENKIMINVIRNTKREKKIVNTFTAHIKNMVKGLTEGHRYVLKICSGHFPMNVSVNGDEFVVKNFLGEKTPRVIKIKKGAQVKIEGDKVIVESISKDVAGQVSADIEELTKRVNYDTRIFQDGIYMIEKDGKQLG